MLQRTLVAILGALMIAGLTPSLLAQGGAVSLEEQLKAQYQFVKMGADSNGAAVTEQGTILVVQKGGILGVPYKDVNLVPTKYQDGQMHTPNNMMMKGIGSVFKKANLGDKQQETHLFQVGDKVYPSRIAVDASKDKVTMSIIACDACNNTNPTTFYKADVVFQFAKGYLAKASPPQITDTIAQVFTIDDSGGDQGSGGGQDQGQGGGGGQGQGGQQGGGQQQQQQGPPPTIQMGQSVDDVVNSLGQPEKIVNLGAKQIYYYKDMKITFTKGKITDIQ